MSGQQFEEMKGCYLPMRNDQQKITVTAKARKQREDLITNKMLMVFGGSALYLFIITLIRNSGIVGGVERSTLTTVVFIALMAVTLVLSGVSAVLHLRMRRNGGKPEDKLLNWMNLGLTSLTVFFCTALQYLFSALGAIISYVVVIAAAALAIVYWLVRRECFVSMLILGLSAVVFYWIYRVPHALSLWMNSEVYLELIYAVALVCVAALVLVLNRTHGVLRLGKRNIRLLNERFGYLPVWISLAAVALMFAACAVLGTQFFYYAVFATVILLVGYGVYYILQLI